MDQPPSPPNPDSIGPVAIEVAANSQVMARRPHWFGEDQPVGAIAQFLLPAMLFYVAFTAYPALLTMWDSAFRVLPNRPPRFMGFSNYVAVLTQDETFWHAVRNTLVWAVAGPSGEITLALLLALALYTKIPGARISASCGSRRC